MSDSKNSSIKEPESHILSVIQKIPIDKTQMPERTSALPRWGRGKPTETPIFHCLSQHQWRRRKRSRVVECQECGARNPVHSSHLSLRYESFFSYSSARERLSVAPGASATEHEAVLVFARTLIILGSLEQSSLLPPSLCQALTPPPAPPPHPQQPISN